MRELSRNNLLKPNSIKEVICDMLKWFESKNEKDCCGCRACEQVCPTSAITMAENTEGFLYPYIDNNKCVKCSLCERTCPIMSRPSGTGIKKAYALQHKNMQLLHKSSSGGAFYLLGDEIINHRGAVVGCVWNKDFRPVLTIATNEKELRPMQGSKYLYSDTNGSFSDVKALLDKGTEVLFTGTPCQCAAMINFLRKPYDNLFTADFICHGVPSQMAFDAYLAEYKKAGKVVEYKFRDKDKQGWGVVSSISYSNGKKRSMVGITDPYDYGFLNGYFNRYSCYSCAFRGEKRFTDFTFCDYWGIEKHNDHGFDLKKGVSALSVNTEKACNFFENIKHNADYVETTAEHVSQGNPSLTRMVSEKIPNVRKFIYSEIQQNGWNAVAKKYLYCNGRLIKRVWYALPNSISNVIRKLFGK